MTTDQWLDTGVIAAFVFGVLGWLHCHGRLIHGIRNRVMVVDDKAETLYISLHDRVAKLEAAAKEKK